VEPSWGRASYNLKASGHRWNSLSRLGLNLQEAVSKLQLLVLRWQLILVWHVLMIMMTL
jgi:hypothetical protein